MIFMFVKEHAYLMPDSIKKRPVCYWGINCRTMEHNLEHSKKYSHMDYQTRFWSLIPLIINIYCIDRWQSLIDHLLRIFLQIVCKWLLLVREERYGFFYTNTPYFFSKSSEKSLERRLSFYCGFLVSLHIRIYWNSSGRMSKFLERREKRSELLKYMSWLRV